MKLFVFGSSLTSCYWNGAATYYRGIYKNLALLGHSITFAEPDIYDRQKNRDADEFDHLRSVIYKSRAEMQGWLAEAGGADVVIKHSGVGADDDLLESAVLQCRSDGTRVIFWDVDAPATLDRLEADAGDPFRKLVPHYDFVFTYGGGEAVAARYKRLGAKNCHPIYNGLDPSTHYPVPPDPCLQCDLVFLGNRLPDRERRVEKFFFSAAQKAPQFSFILGGEGWSGKRLPQNVRWIGHVKTADHNRINCSARMVLNVNRDSMANAGFSPPTRIFEAAGAGACTITDRWDGIEKFFTPDKEILLAGNSDDIVELLASGSPDRVSRIGTAMRKRALRDHTYALRAREVDQILLPAEVLAMQH